MSNKEKNLSLMGHLKELRIRLLRIVIVTVILIGVAFAFHDQLFEFLRHPAPDGIILQAIKLTEMIGTSMRISFIAGIILAIPYITFELLMFVSPALTKREKKYIYIIFPWVLLSFLSGLTFAYFFLIPKIVTFLFDWGSNIVAIQPMFSDYINIVLRLLLMCGLIFEFPVLTTFLARLGILNPKWLSDRRKPAIIIAFILGALITPTVDPINQCIVAGILVILYETSIWCAKLVYPRKKKKQ